MLIARGSGVVPCEAHNLVTPVQFRPPQHTGSRDNRAFLNGLRSPRRRHRNPKMPHKIQAVEFCARVAQLVRAKDS